MNVSVISSHTVDEFFTHSLILGIGSTAAVFRLQASSPFPVIRAAAEMYTFKPKDGFITFYRALCEHRKRNTQTHVLTGVVQQRHHAPEKRVETRVHLVAGI